MHDPAVAIENVRSVLIRLALIEGEEVVRDGNCGIARRGNRVEQIEGTAKFLVKDGPRQVVAARRIAIEEETTANEFVRLVDRDVRPGHLRVANEKRGGRQPAKSATDDMRLHRSPPSLPVGEQEVVLPSSSLRGRLGP